MLFPIKRLLEGRDKPLCIYINQNINDALRKMVENDFSQLPVINDHGELEGLITVDVILRRYYHLKGIIGMLDLTVDHCLIPAITLEMEQDIFEALDRLKDTYAVIIIESKKPIGILTEYDMAHFFRDLTEDLLIIEDIETSLRQIVQGVYPEDEDLIQALISEFGESKDDPGQPNLKFDQLTFSQLIRLIKNPVNWNDFMSILTPLELFQTFMDQVRQNRNQLAHFRGRLDTVQHDALKQSQQWLESRPNLTFYKPTKLKEKDIKAAEKQREQPGAGKYDPLREYLERKHKEKISIIQISFSDMETLLGIELPEAARQHRSWWGNEHANPQSEAWMSVGWLVTNVDLGREEVSFRQSRSAFYPYLFEALLKGFKERRPGITYAEKVSMANWFSFGSGKAGISFGWVFTKEHVLRVELYIDLGDQEKNKRIFDDFVKDKDAIEDEIGETLNWERLDAHRASRISISRPFDFNQSEEIQDETKEWGIATMLKFIDTFKKRVAALKVV
jgi:Domain of unknown function (DUF4268)/CBS domain